MVRKIDDTHNNILQQLQKKFASPPSESSKTEQKKIGDPPPIEESLENLLNSNLDSTPEQKKSVKFKSHRWQLLQQTDVHNTDNTLFIPPKVEPKKNYKCFGWWIKKVVIVSICTILMVPVVGFVMFIYFGKDLSNYGYLKTYEPPVSSRVYANDGKLLQQFAKERRVFIPITDIPDSIKHAFLSAEDKNFYTHGGVDLIALFKAIPINIKNKIQDRRSVGASTITQQVARYFFLGNERNFTRKIKEAILAFRIENELSKDRIFELYLNQIYLGRGTYGVAAASMKYFNRPPSELKLSQIAYLASLPKAPNNYHPTQHSERAIARRNWVLNRMFEEGFISEIDMRSAQQEPLDAMQGVEPQIVSAEYFVEEARREIANKFSTDTLYTGGLTIHTTLNTTYQKQAYTALNYAILEYDKRHGYRGAFVNLSKYSDWKQRFYNIKPQAQTKDWIQAVVTEINTKSATVLLKNKRQITLPFQAVEWARPYGYPRAGVKPEKMADVLKKYDVIFLQNITPDADTPTYELRQVPQINGALVALDPHTGRVLAMVGGWDFSGSQFNRATQAKRQTGSAIKPFVYYAGLESGMTPATRILDAPFVLTMVNGDKWKPQNFSNKFFGLSILRVGVESSRNLMTVRLAQEIGMDRVSSVFKRFNIMQNPQPLLSFSLGAGETTLLKMVTAYSILVNGGKKITPSLISRVQDRYGKVIFRHLNNKCDACNMMGDTMPKIQDNRVQIANSINAYQVVTMLEGVVKNGTGKKMQSLNIPMGGKTGTTNNMKDAWFISITPDLVVGAFLGFDNPRPLGQHPPGEEYDWWTQETGSRVALPAVKKFYEGIVDTLPKIPFRIPQNVRMVTIDKDTGGVVTKNTKHPQLEAFIPGTEPTQDTQDGYNTSTNLDGVY